MLRNQEYSQIVYLTPADEWVPGPRNGDTGNLNVTGYSIQTCLNNLYSLRERVDAAIRAAEKSAESYRKEGVT